MNITERSSKSDIIDSSLELIDTQTEKIQTLQGQVNTLFWCLGVVLIWNLLF